MRSKTSDVKTMIFKYFSWILSLFILSNKFALELIGIRDSLLTD